MSNLFDPKSAFNQQETVAADYRKLVDRLEFQMATIHAMAQFASFNPSHEELKGANAFLDILLNFGLKDTPTKPATFTQPRLTPPELLVPTEEEPKKK